MRPLIVPITGTTDASGAAAITVQLPRSDEWHVAKFVLSASVTGKWGVTLGGSPTNFGLGDRVTMGPELIQPMDVVKVSITSGPLSSPISGTMYGVSGTEDEVLPYYLPQSNLTSILSTTAAAQAGLLLHTTAPSAVSANAGTFQVPAGTESLSIVTVPSGASGNSSFSIDGVTSGFRYYNGVNTTVTPSLEVVPVDPNTDPIVGWSWGSFPGNSADWFVSALPTAAPVNGSLLLPPWQAPRLSVSKELAAVSSVAMRAGAAGQVIRLFDWTIEIDQATAFTIGWLEDDAFAVGAVAGRLAAFASAGNGALTGNAGGRALSFAAGLRLNVPAVTGGVVRAMAGISQV